MANSEIRAGALVSSAKTNDATSGTTAPVSPFRGQIWTDTTPTEPDVQLYNASSAWYALSGADGRRYWGRR